MAWKIILNPYARRKHAQKNWLIAEHELKRLGIDYEVEFTKESGHATKIAREAFLQGYTPIIAAGGDGTISEVVNGLAQANPNKNFPLGPLGIIPLGTSNDLAFSLGLSTDPRKAVDTISKGNVNVIDLGKVNGRYFSLNSAIGIEALGSVYQNKIKVVHGPFRYLIASLLCLMKNPKWNMELTWKDHHYKGEASLVTVGNNCRSAGFYIAPSAKLDDGQLTFVCMSTFPRHELVRILPMSRNPAEGNYTEVDGINEYHTKKLCIKIDPPSPLHVDGELISLGISELEYSVVPNGLKVIC